MSTNILSTNVNTGLSIANQPTTSDIIINALSIVKNNPASIASVILSELEQLNGGTVRIVDPTNPVVFVLEAAVMLAASAMSQAATLTRRQYPSLAQTEEDLFPHMSDNDYLNRFGYPANATFTLLLNYNEFILKAAPIPSSLLSKITIPRYTEFTVSNMSFTLQYPIDIQYSVAGGIVINWDINSFASPILNISNTALNYDLINISGVLYIRINIPALQMQITSYTVSVNASTGFNKSYTFPDQFFYCRAFIQNNGATGWTEISVSQSTLVYDPTKPTITLTVNTQTNTVVIGVPQIYLTNGLINNSLRIDLYTTLGTLNASLSNYSPNTFNAFFNDIDNTAGIYGSIWQMFSGKALYADGYVTGGSNGLTFNQLRTQVMNNSYGTPNVPITIPQLNNVLNQNGFDLMIDQDSLLQRVYMATAALPAPDYEGAYSPANCAIQTLQASIAQLEGFSTINYNGGNRLTIRPSTLMQNNNGVLSIVPSSIMNNLLAYVAKLNTAQLVMTLNSNNYVYTPFHYVYDTTGSEFIIRPYFLTSPTILNKYIVAQNLTIPIQISTAAYLIEYLDTPTFLGYKLYLITASGSTSTINLNNFQILAQSGNLGVQLSYNIPGVGVFYGYLASNSITQIATITGLNDNNKSSPVIKPATISSELWGILLANSPAEYLIEFNITTNFDIDSNNNLLLTDLNYNSTLGNQNYPCSLNTTFNIIYILLDYAANSGISSTNIDNLVDVGLFSTRTNILNNGLQIPTSTMSFVAVIQETMDIVFGVYLENLWQNTRTVASPLQYETYTANIPMVYTEDVYMTGSTGSVIINADANGNPIATKIHSASDPVLDANGNQLLLHKIGDYILDINNNPIPLGGSLNRAIIYSTDLFVLDGKYYFATDAQTVSYLNNVISEVVSWIINDISNIQSNMLERTELYFYPKTTMGVITVTPGSGLSFQINSEQTLSVTIDLTVNQFNNTTLKNTLVSSITPIIVKMLNSNVVSIPAIENAIATTLNNEIIGVTISGLGGANNFRTITLNDSSTMPSIAKVAVVLADYSISVQDSIVFIFNKQGF